MKINHLLEHYPKKCQYEIYELKFINLVFNRIKIFKQSRIKLN